MDVNWELSVGFDFCAIESEQLISAIMTIIGRKTSTGQSTIWGIQRQRNGQYWVRFREAAHRDLLLKRGGFMLGNEFIHIFPIGENLHWLKINDLPVILETSSIKSALQQYGIVWKIVQETVPGFDDVYNGNLRILLQVLKEVPSVVSVSGYCGHVLWAEPMRQIGGAETSDANIGSQRPRHECALAVPCEINNLVVNCNSTADEEEEYLVTDAVLIEEHQASSLRDELRRLRLDSMGAAMAWGYFIYLRDTALSCYQSKLKERIQNYEDREAVTVAESLQKLIIFLPLSCSYQPSEDMVIEHAQNLETVEQDVAGTFDRSYHLPAYKMREGKEKIYFIPETAQCLFTLATMCKQSNRTGLTKDLQDLIRDQFVEVLEFLLYQDRKCEGKFEILRVAEGTDDAFRQEIQVLRKKPESLPAYIPDVSTYCWPYDNFGVGLANWYYFNYLIFIFEGLPKLMAEWEEKEQYNYKIYPRLMILVPNSCLCKDLISEDEKEVERVTSFDIELDAGTTKQRKYSVTLYKVKTGNKQHIQYCAPQYATPIRQLYKMTEVSNYCLDKDVMAEAREDFVKELRRLLSVNKKYESICEVVPFDDDRKKVSQVLKELLITESNKQ